MKFSIIGPGAIGILIGSLLHRAGHEVEFVCKNLDQMESVRKGVKVVGLVDYEFIPEAYLHYEGNSDYIFITVKSYDTESAVKKIKKISDEIVLTLQNGIGNYEIIKKKVRRVLIGITSCGSTKLSDTTIRFVGKGITKIGSLEKDMENEVNKIVEIFRGIGLPTAKSEDIYRDLWLKAAVNSVINSLTSIFCVKNGELIRSNYLRSVMKILADECEKVLCGMGYNINVYDEAYKIAEDTSENFSSTLQDILRGRRTEVDYFLKPFVDRGNSPILKIIYNMVKYREGAKCPE